MKKRDHSYRIQSNPIHGWIQSMSNSGPATVVWSAEFDEVGRSSMLRL